MSKQLTYGIFIPAYVLYSDVSDGAKLLYGRLRTFWESKEPKTVYASNKWLGNEIGKGEEQTARLVKELVNAGFVKSKLINYQDKGTRRILIDSNRSIKDNLPEGGGVSNMIPGGYQKRDPGGIKNEDQVLGVKYKEGSSSPHPVPSISEAEQISKQQDSIAKKYDTAVQKWNEMSDYKTRYTSLETMDYLKQEDIARYLNPYSLDEILYAVDNYNKHIPDFAPSTSFMSFIKNKLEQYVKQNKKPRKSSPVAPAPKFDTAKFNKIFHRELIKQEKLVGHELYGKEHDDFYDYWHAIAESGDKRFAYES
jgi:hypothetical protein